jgi:D-sedoheptulose 7-phosphate isomerase
MDLKAYLKQSYQDAANIFTLLSENNLFLDTTVVLSQVLANAFSTGQKVLICGNGGSLCDAIHFAEEFTGRYRLNRDPLPVIALSDSAHITCVGNDYGFKDIFARGVQAYAKPGDILIVLSTSGNSENIVAAVNTATRMGLTTIALLGKDGGQLKGVCSYEFIVPGKTSDRIQEFHMAILHILIEGVERLLFPSLYL